MPAPPCRSCPQAIQHYTEALKRGPASVNPDAYKLYSNMALCYTKLCAYPEGIKVRGACDSPCSNCHRCSIEGGACVRCSAHGYCLVSPVIPGCALQCYDARCSAMIQTLLNMLGVYLRVMTRTNCVLASTSCLCMLTAPQIYWHAPAQHPSFPDSSLTGAAHSVWHPLPPGLTQ